MTSAQKPQPPLVEIETPDCLTAWLTGVTRQSPAVVQNLDLRRFAGAIRRQAFPGSLFLSCDIDPETAGHIVTSGGVVIPELGDFAFSLHRPTLYTCDDLFAGFAPDDPLAYQHTLDARIYAEYLAHGPHSPAFPVSLARSLHDHAITAALDVLVRGERVVAIMGGHGMERGADAYVQVARIARTLTRDGFLIATGGGPGAMEAAHLGAYLARRADEDLDGALSILRPRPPGAAPEQEFADPDWLHRAMAVRAAFPLAPADIRHCRSVGIPTWFYGHEPPAPFPTHIAKYFANSIREDGLLHIAHHGVVFAPGSAGTTQEIFQDAAQNHYGTAGVISPMILFGVEHWTKTRPVWDFLRAAAAGQRFGELLSLTDDEHEVVARVRNFHPAEYRV